MNRTTETAKQLVESLRTKIVELYKETRSAYVVAKQLLLSHKAVYRVLHEEGVQLPPREGPKLRKRKFSPFVEAAAVVDYVAGVPFAQLCEKYKCGTYVMREAARRAGVELRDHGGQRRRVRNDEVAGIVKLYVEDGLSQWAIARHIGCHQVVISKILRAAGISKRKNEGADHGSWKGGVSKDGQGYVLQQISNDHPMACMRGRSGYVRQNRLVMAQHLGRPLEKYETVHHKDGVRTNNVIDNLQLRVGQHGKGAAMRCRCCGSNDIEVSEL